jgi:hypothetical protein
MWSKMRLKAKNFVSERHLSREDVIEATMIIVAVLLFVSANSCQA